MRWHAVVWVIVLLGLVYGLDVGRGFIGDDVVTVAYRPETLSDVVALARQPSRPYRPLTAMSFAIDRVLFDRDSHGFGLTSFVLLAMAVVTVARMAYALGLSPVASTITSAVWAFNIHGIAVAVLWLSGRSILLAALFATMSASRVLRRRRWRAALFALLAMLSRSELALLPFIFLAWAWIDADDVAGSRLRFALRRTWPMGVALIIYLGLRVTAGVPAWPVALWPPTLWQVHGLQHGIDPLAAASALARALVHIGLFSLLTGFVAWLTMRHWPKPDRQFWRLLPCMAAWFVLTLPLAFGASADAAAGVCAPSIAVAWLPAWLIDQYWREAGTIDRRRLAGGLLLFGMAMLLVYWNRNEKLVAPAHVSAQVFRTVAAATARRDVTHIVITDRSTCRGPSLFDIYGDAAPDALRFASPRPVVISIEPARVEWKDKHLPPPPANGSGHVVHLVFEDGQIIRR